MVDRRLIQEWLDKADEDYQFASANLREGSNFYAQICFHFQQAAEKYLKALIVAHGFEPEKIHNLMALLKACAKTETSLLSLMDECEILNTAYIDTRYPVHWPASYTKEKAEKLRAAAKKVGEAVKKLLAVA